MESIIVIFPRPEDAVRIRRLLIKGGCSVYAACSSASAALQAADRLGEGIVVCAARLPDMMYDRLLELLPGSFDMLVLASRRMIEEGLVEERLLPEETQKEKTPEEDPRFNGSYGAVRALELPAPLETILDTLDEMEQRRSFCKHGIKGRSWVRTQEEKRVLNQAKQALMERRGITEEEAHRYLQKASMENGTNVVETAQMLLSLLG